MSIDREGSLSDGELIRSLHGEPNGVARSELEARLAEQPDARMRLDQFERRAARLSGLLAELDPAEAEVQQSAHAIRLQVAHDSVLPTRRMRPMLKVAAAIVLLLGLAFAVPPARAWMIERIRDAAVALGLESRAGEPETSAASADVRVADVTFGFEIEAGTLDLFVPQRAGRVILRRSGSSRGSAEAIGAAGTSFVLLPRGLRIEGPSIADAAYVIALPAQVSSVRVHRLTQSSGLHPLPAAGAETSIELSSR